MGFELGKSENIFLVQVALRIFQLRMCVTRVGRILSINGVRAEVRFFDGGLVDDVDVSTLKKILKGEYIEVFNNIALSKLRTSEVRTRKEAWRSIMRVRGREEMKPWPRVIRSGQGSPAGKSDNQTLAD